MCKYFGAVFTIARRAVECQEWTFQGMLVHSIGIVLVDTRVSWTIYNSKWAVIELVIVYLIDIKFLSASNVGACYHGHIIHLSR